MTVSAADRAAVRRQLGRTPRGLRKVAHRCRCGLPDVIETAPRLEDGTPFPTTFYLTCPRAVGAVGTLEASGAMALMTQRLQLDADLRQRYRAAHEDYLARRVAIERDAMEPDAIEPDAIEPHAIDGVPELAGISAGGMPERVKCLHVLVAHSLAAGPGVNPLGDEALAGLEPWGERGPCVSQEQG